MTEIRKKPRYKEPEEAAAPQTKEIRKMKKKLRQIIHAQNKKILNHDLLSIEGGSHSGGSLTRDDRNGSFSLHPMPQGNSKGGKKRNKYQAYSVSKLRNKFKENDNNLNLGRIQESSLAASTLAGKRGRRGGFGNLDILSGNLQVQHNASISPRANQGRPGGQASQQQPLPSIIRNAKLLPAIGNTFDQNEMAKRMELTRSLSNTLETADVTEVYSRVSKVEVTMDRKRDDRDLGTTQTTIMAETRRERDWDNSATPKGAIKLSSRLGQAERQAPDKEPRKIKFADAKVEIAMHIRNNSRLSHVSPNKLLQFSQLSKLQKHDPGAAMRSPHTPALGSKAASPPPQQSAQPPRAIISNRASPVILDAGKPQLPPTSPKESQQIIPPPTPKEKDKQDAQKNQKQLQKIDDLVQIYGQPMHKKASNASSNPTGSLPTSPRKPMTMQERKSKLKQQKQSVKKQKEILQAQNFRLDNITLALLQDTFRQEGYARPQEKVEKDGKEVVPVRSPSPGPEAPLEQFLEKHNMRSKFEASFKRGGSSVLARPEDRPTRLSKLSQKDQAAPSRRLVQRKFDSSTNVKVPPSGNQAGSAQGDLNKGTAIESEFDLDSKPRVRIEVDVRQVAGASSSHARREADPPSLNNSRTGFFSPQILSQRGASPLPSRLTRKSLAASSRVIEELGELQGQADDIDDRDLMKVQSLASPRAAVQGPSINNIDLTPIKEPSLQYSRKLGNFRSHSLARQKVSPSELEMAENQKKFRNFGDYAEHVSPPEMYANQRMGYETLQRQGVHPLQYEQRHQKVGARSPSQMKSDANLLSAGVDLKKELMNLQTQHRDHIYQNQALLAIQEAIKDKAITKADLRQLAKLPKSGQQFKGVPIFGIATQAGGPGPTAVSKAQFRPGNIPKDVFLQRQKEVFERARLQRMQEQQYQQQIVQQAQQEYIEKYRKGDAPAMNNTNRAQINQVLLERQAALARDPPKVLNFSSRNTLPTNKYTMTPGGITRTAMQFLQQQQQLLQMNRNSPLADPGTHQTVLYTNREVPGERVDINSEILNSMRLMKSLSPRVGEQLRHIQTVQDQVISQQLQHQRTNSLGQAEAVDHPTPQALVQQQQHQATKVEDTHQQEQQKAGTPVQQERVPAQTVVPIVENSIENQEVLWLGSPHQIDEWGSTWVNDDIIQKQNIKSARVRALRPQGQAPRRPEDAAPFATLRQDTAEGGTPKHNGRETTHGSDRRGPRNSEPADGKAQEPQPRQQPPPNIHLGTDRKSLSLIQSGQQAVVVGSQMKGEQSGRRPQEARPAPTHRPVVVPLLDNNPNPLQPQQIQIQVKEKKSRAPRQTTTSHPEQGDPTILEPYQSPYKLDPSYHLRKRQQLQIRKLQETSQLRQDGATSPERGQLQPHGIQQQQPPTTHHQGPYHIQLKPPVPPAPVHEPVSNQTTIAYNYKDYMEPEQHEQEYLIRQTEDIDTWLDRRKLEIENRKKEQALQMEMYRKM